MTTMHHARVDMPRDLLDELCARWKVRELALFGSAGDGDPGPAAVLVTFRPDAAWSLLDLQRLRDELCIGFGRKVGLVEEEALRNPFRRQAIRRDRIVLHAS